MKRFNAVQPLSVWSTSTPVQFDQPVFSNHSLSAREAAQFVAPPGHFHYRLPLPPRPRLADATPRSGRACFEPEPVPMSRRRQIYEGKAKILYEGPEPGTLIQYFKDDATAF